MSMIHEPINQATMHRSLALCDGVRGLAYAQSITHSVFSHSSLLFVLVGQPLVTSSRDVLSPCVLGETKVPPRELDQIRWRFTSEDALHDITVRSIERRLVLEDSAARLGAEHVLLTVVLVCLCCVVKRCSSAQYELAKVA